MIGITSYLIEAALLSAATYSGVALRYWLNRFSSSVDAVDVQSPIYPDLLPNIIGCCFMGVISAMKDSYFVSSESRMLIYSTLTSGFAGSLTTFSGWNGYASIAVTRTEMPVSVYLMVLLISFSLSIVSLVFGRHLAELLRFLKRRLMCTDNTPKQKSDAVDASTAAVQLSHTPDSSRVLWTIRIGWAIFLMASIVWIVLAAVLEHSRGFWLAMLFGPVGTYVRFRLSTLLNPKFPKFPLGTFLVNIVGTAIYGALVLIYHRKTGTIRFEYFDNPNTRPTYYVIPALTLGFCGGLTTVSTLTNEVYLMKPKYGYLYAFASVAVAQILLLVINLPYWKTR